MTQATITLTRRDTGEKIGTEHYSASDWTEIVYRARNWLATEVNPYWTWGALAMSWDTEDKLVSAGLFGIAVCFGSVCHDP
jgi:hypothetical protein